MFLHHNFCARCTLMSSTVFNEGSWNLADDLSKPLLASKQQRLGKSTPRARTIGCLLTSVRLVSAGKQGNRPQLSVRGGQSRYQINHRWRPLLCPSRLYVSLSSTPSTLFSTIMATKAATGKVARLLQQNQPQIEHAINADPEFKASAQRLAFTFAVKTPDMDDFFVFNIYHGEVRTYLNGKADFLLCARQRDWLAFFADPQPRFCHSYWSILRTAGREAPEDVCILGDQGMFGRYARVWRLVLERTREGVCGLECANTSGGLEETSVDPTKITGQYTILDHPSWGPCQTYYETAGHGPQPLLLLHTAGSDSRQNHAIMTQPTLLSKCTIYALDLPSHGRSYPITNAAFSTYRLTEDDYIYCIALFLRHLNLHNSSSPTNKIIVCGASMAGHVCLSLATRAVEMDIGGVIPLEAAAHLPLVQPPYELPHDAVNESVLNAERVYSMLGPNASVEARRCIWWTYASQAPGVFQGDLAFYFGGWDGRDRLGAVDTKRCPVYMGTGEWDYSCTAEVGRETAEMIGTVFGEQEGEDGLVEGVRFENLEGLGHFPLTEDPVRMGEWVVRAVEWIQGVRAE